MASGGKVEEKRERLVLSRRNFLKGLSAGAATAAVGAGIVKLQEAEAHVPEILPGAKKKLITLDVNGKIYRLEVENQWTLLDVLRNELHLTGTKRGCDRGTCGFCTVLMDGKSIYSCMELAVESEGKKILTIEGLLQGDKLHPIQQAFVEHDGMQCGFCTPGQIMSTKELLDKNRNPSKEEVKEALAGVLCRCGAYPKIVESALAAAKLI